MKILLMGNPNVGKSVVFNRLTGVDVISSNYSSTTISFTKGCLYNDSFKSCGRKYLNMILFFI